MRASLHPLARSVPAEAATSWQSVARYIAEHEPDHVERIKALHDWIADHIAYDVASYRSNELAPQTADQAFHDRKAVCGGYARLLADMGRAAGEEIVVVVGDARTQSSDLGGEGHAWNAARIDGQYYLVDVTWDAGPVDGDRFVKRYSTSYLFTPPRVFGIEHFPDAAGWQLRADPLSRGDFLRQPMARPELFALGLELVWPDRSQVTVDRDLWLTIGNPGGVPLIAAFAPMSADRSSAGADCETHPARQTKIHCDFPTPDAYVVTLFAGTDVEGLYRGVARFEVNRR